MSNILDIKQLRVEYPARSGAVRAVRDVSLSIPRGEVVGLVGESGCGKSSLAKAVMGLTDAAGGTVHYQGDPVQLGARSDQRALRKHIQMVFQDPFASLNPRLSIRAALQEVLLRHKICARSETDAHGAALLEEVGLDAAQLDRYPHEFSGGQRQRLGIARALAVDPKVILADEPVSALDVSVQVQILNLLKKLQRDRGLSMLFIAHDLAVVRYLCDRVYVMYLGEVVEQGRTEDVFTRPAHPYTEALLSAVPDVGSIETTATDRQRIVLEGDVPSPAEQVPGCPFHTRCHRMQPRCRGDKPALESLTGEHAAACHFKETVQSENRNQL